MKASQVKASVKALSKIKQPLFIWGAPGIGKSQIIAQVAKEENLQLIDDGIKEGFECHKDS